MGMLLELIVEGWKIRRNTIAGLFDRSLLPEHDLFNAFFVPAFRKRPLYPGSYRLLQIYRRA
jgi:hypothetical protein